MAKKTEFLLLGGTDGVQQPDALVGFDDSSESGVTMTVRSKDYTPLGPAGSLVGKRMFTSGRHRNGIAITIEPYIDGLPLGVARQHFARPPFGFFSERFSFLQPLWESHKSDLYSTGPRGTTWGFKITADMPSTDFSLETVQLELHQLMTSRGSEAEEARGI